MSTMFSIGDGHTVELEERMQYGCPVLHPANDWARMACQLADTRTLTRGSVDTLKRYGFRVVVIPAPGRVL